jgi:hypothetical protein
MTCAMKTNYIQSNNNNNRIKPTRSARIAVQIMEDAHADMGFRFSHVRAVVCSLVHKHPLLNDAGIRRKFYFQLMNEMFVG